MGPNSLRSEELMTQVDRHAVVPIGDGHVLRLVPVVVAGIVAEHLKRAVLRNRFTDRVLQRLDIAQIAGNEERRSVTISVYCSGKLTATLLGDIDESDPAALGAEVPHQAFADAARPAGDEHTSASEARIAGVGHKVVAGISAHRELRKRRS